MLPTDLQQNLLYEVRVPIIKEHDFFQFLDEENEKVARRLCFEALTSEFVPRGEIVFEKGDPCDRMVFIFRGEFDYAMKAASDLLSYDSRMGPMGTNSSAVADSTVVSSNVRGFLSRIHQHLPKNDDRTIVKGVWLAEAALWVKWENQGTLAASTDGCLFSLEFERFTTCLLRFPDILPSVKAYGQEFVEQVKHFGFVSDIVRIRMTASDPKPRLSGESGEAFSPQGTHIFASKSMKSVTQAFTGKSSLRTKSKDRLGTRQGKALTWKLSGLTGQRQVSEDNN